MSECASLELHKLAKIIRDPRWLKCGPQTSIFQTKTGSSYQQCSKTLLYATDWHQRPLRWLKWWNPHLKANSISWGLPTLPPFSERTFCSAVINSKFPSRGKDTHNNGAGMEGTLLVKRFSDICVMQVALSALVSSFHFIFYLERLKQCEKKEEIPSVQGEKSYVS